ncbi:Do family serine endopeptidase [Phenylobacterium montanum]|uniref:Do family serine endopeptidase n=1 Tax=Phenylobacterium montanum TaxID=2823693 RepID=A0A975G3G4_9CAUL|nr:Do family serine endopeptidase [Caulobacter sp. S6]QUD90440.1 Do family serine endopeptidase [Caulobacter sp. S6]
MKKTQFIAGAAVGAVATVLAGAGGYWARGAEAATAGEPAALASASPSSFADIVQKVSPAVVSIDVEGKAKRDPAAFRGQAPQLPFGFEFRQLVPEDPEGAPAPKMRATGSGFLISSDGYIVTNNHVIDGADDIKVRLTDGRELKAHLVGRDAATDIAVVKVEGHDFTYVSFEDRAKPRVGDWVVAVGNPFGLGGTATAGIVSALGRKNVSDSNYVDYMQIDAPINRGNSGGPTFDVQGRVVGVNTAIFSPSGGSVGIGFDIPADVAAQVSKQLISGGKVVRGYIGAAIQDVTPEIADSLGLAQPKGALVAELTPGGPSQRAGLQPGDVVQKINGREVASASDLTRQVALASAGETLKLDVLRNGRVQAIDVHSGIRPSEAQLASNDTPDEAGAGGAEPASSKVLGMRLEPNASGGVTIDGVGRGSDAADKGLQAGDVILSAAGRPTATPADLSAAVAQQKREGRKAVLLMVQRDGRRSFVPLSLSEAKG